jgi:hypothetical protein
MPAATWTTKFRSETPAKQEDFMADKLQVKVIPDNTPDMTNEQGGQAALDPFNPENLRIDLNISEGVGVKKAIITIPVRKPNGQEYIRVHTGPAYRLPVALIELRDDREIYLVTSSVAAQIQGEYFLATMFTCINRAGVLSLWPVRLPGSDGRQLDWHRSAAQAAEMAMTRWVRIKSNMNLRAYEVYEASATIPDPVWPDLLYKQMLEIAFKDRLVNSLDHPVLKQLRGEA